MTESAGEEAAPKSTRFLRPERVKEATLLAIIAVSVLVFAFLIEGYLSGRFFNRVTTSVVVVTLLAAAQALVIFSRNIDLSVGAIVGVAAYLTGDFLAATGQGPITAVLVAIVVGAVLGSVNGLLVAYGGVPAIIVTLGTLALFRTLLSIYSEGA
ncbi:MAG: ABC transporter permease, partial [Acidimicrobiia bacterium]